jgi:hypothetical protein
MGRTDTGTVPRTGSLWEPTDATDRHAHTVPFVLPDPATTV